MWAIRPLSKVRLKRGEVTCPSSQSKTVGHKELGYDHPPKPQFTSCCCIILPPCHSTRLTWKYTTINFWQGNSIEFRKNKVSSEVLLPPIISYLSGKNWARCLQTSKGAGKSRHQFYFPEDTGNEDVNQTLLK